MVAALKHHPDIKFIILWYENRQQILYKNLSGDLGINQQIE